MSNVTEILTNYEDTEVVMTEVGTFYVGELSKEMGGGVYRLLPGHFATVEDAQAALDVYLAAEKAK
jgi:hypothetical protein